MKKENENSERFSSGDLLIFNFLRIYLNLLRSVVAIKLKWGEKKKKKENIKLEKRIERGNELEIFD